MALRTVDPGPTALRFWVGKTALALATMTGTATAGTFPAAPAYDAPAFMLEAAGPAPAPCTVTVAAARADDFAALPLSCRYEVDDHLSLDASFELVSLSYADAAGRHTAAGLGDVWVTGRVIWSVFPARAGVRAALKIPTGYYNPADDRPDLGDGQVDADLAFVAGTYPAAGGFRCDWVLGYRYRRESSYIIWQENSLEPEEPIGVDVDYQPGALWYTRFEPGVIFGPGAFRLSLPLFYGAAPQGRMEVMGVDVKAPGSAASTVIVGAAFGWRVLPRWTLNARVLRPARNSGTLLTTTAYILNEFSGLFGAADKTAGESR